jgi:hypothetical protein
MPAVEVSRAKAAVARAADVEQVVSPEAVGREVFAERPEARERFEREVRERQLPEEVPVRRGVANRLTRTHKIRTDTGVEIYCMDCGARYEFPATSVAVARESLDLDEIKLT